MRLGRLWRAALRRGEETEKASSIDLLPSWPIPMKFILVNRRTPCGVSCCAECHRPLGEGYVRDMSTRRPYCNYDCYLHEQTRRLFAPWRLWTESESGGAVDYSAQLRVLTSSIDASCWYSISIARAAMRVVRLMTAEILRG